MLRASWRFWSNVLKSIGGLGCLAAFLWSFGLIGYYSVKRPSKPVPERGWTIALPWTHVSYGTPKEANQLLRLHYWFFPFFIVGVAGAAIEKFHEKYEPWRKI
jgi:hypothetical protein